MKTKLKKLLKKPIRTKCDAVIYIGKLHKYDASYHMDDDATEIINGVTKELIFPNEYGELANLRRDECASLLTNEDYCMHAVGLACFMD